MAEQNNLYRYFEGMDPGFEQFSSIGDRDFIQAVRKISEENRSSTGAKHEKQPLAPDAVPAE